MILLFLNKYIYIYTVQVLGLTFDLLLTWESHIVRMLNRGLFNFIIVVLFSQVKTCMCLCTNQYGNIFYSRAALSHLQHLGNLQT